MDGAIQGLWIVAGAVLGIVFGVVTSLLRGRRVRRRAASEAETLLDEAQEKARRIARNADKKANEMRAELRKEAEAEARERRKGIEAKEHSLASRIANAEKLAKTLDRREAELKKSEEGLGEHRARLEDQERRRNELLAKAREQLERAAGLSAEEAKVELTKNIENEARLEAARNVRHIEDEAKENAQREAQKIIATAIQRWSGDFVVERAVTVLPIPSDDVKGKIIGREGRNIRALQQATGMDFIIDDTPETVVISGFNPVRREVARISLKRLLEDGRIHPARIEEVVRKAEKEVDQDIREAGERAVMDVGLQGVHPEIVKLVGTLKYRYSYSQNNLVHSLEAAYFCGIMAQELGLDMMVGRRCGLLHDIGKAVDHEVEGPHAYIGGDLARKYGEKPDVIVGITGHHEDDPPSIWAALTQSADALSAARPGARREMLENYVKRLEGLERIANSFPGVDRTYAIQAGREIRVIVNHERLTDDAAYILSKDIARKIEQEMTYPGQIKVTVLRETRAVDYAR